MSKWLTGEWFIDRTSACRRCIIHYWATTTWQPSASRPGSSSETLWFVGFMSLYAIWVTHLAGWAAETPVEAEADTTGADRGSAGSAEVDSELPAQAEPYRRAHAPPRPRPPCPHLNVSRIPENTDTAVNRIPPRNRMTPTPDHPPEDPTTTPARSRTKSQEQT